MTISRERIFSIIAALVALLGLTGQTTIVGDDPEQAVCLDADTGIEFACDPPDTTTTTTTSTTTTAAPTTTTTTTTSTTTTAPPTTTTTVPGVEDNVRHFCDFATECPLDNFVQYRDRFNQRHTSGRSDHASTGGDDCTSPFTTRRWDRNTPADFHYLCWPGGNSDAAHRMSVVPDTSGYTFTGSAFPYVYQDVERVSFEVNMTSFGARNFWEVAVIPADQSFTDGMPCINEDLPCNNGFNYATVDGYGFGNHGHEGSRFHIATPTDPHPEAYTASGRTTMPNGDTLFTTKCSGSGWCNKASVHNNTTDIAARYQVIIEDRPDGLWFGQELTDGSFAWATAPGEHLPEGPVRVILKFHGYTPTKDGQGPGFSRNNSPSVGAATWHWDDLLVEAGSAMPSINYYDGLYADHFVTSTFGADCVAFGEGQRGNPNGGDIAPLIVCGDETAY